MKRVTAIVLVLVLITILAACSSAGNGGRVALVNGHSISTAELDTRLKIYELFFKQPMGDPSTKQQLLDQMINEYLLVEQADKLQVEVTDAQVENELGKFLGALDRQYQGREAVTDKLQSLGLTNEALVDFARQSLISQAVVAKQKQTVALTDTEVKSFYIENLEKLYQPKEQVVRAAQILVPLDQEEKAQEVAAKAKAGGNFAELAKLYSVDAGSSRSGGDLGYFTRGTMVKEVADVAFSLKAGEISGPVKSAHGWHVIMVIDRRGAGLIPFDQAREDAANRLLPQKQDQRFDQWLRDLQQAAKVQKVSMAGSSSHA